MEKCCFRLRRAADFQLLFKQGRSLASPGLVLYYLPNQLVESRVAFCVGKKLGCAVARNRMRRRMKEAFRSIENEINIGYDIAWVARKKVLEMEFNLLIMQMKDLLIKSQLIG